MLKLDIVKWTQESDFNAVTFLSPCTVYLLSFLLLYNEYHVIFMLWSFLPKQCNCIRENLILAKGLLKQQQPINKQTNKQNKTNILQ